MLAGPAVANEIDVACLSNHGAAIVAIDTTSLKQAFVFGPLVTPKTHTESLFAIMDTNGREFWQGPNNLVWRLGGKGGTIPLAIAGGPCQPYGQMLLVEPQVTPPSQGR